MFEFVTFKSPKVRYCNVWMLESSKIQKFMAEWKSSKMSSTPQPVWQEKICQMSIKVG